jgi:hypothetical protein
MAKTGQTVNKHLALSAVSAQSQVNPTVSDALIRPDTSRSIPGSYPFLPVGLDTETELPSWEGFASFAS